MKNIIFELRKKLTESVKSSRACGLLFSGGLDTSILASINSQIDAITISLNSFGEDIQYARLVARELKLRHYHKSISIDEALNSIPSIIKILKSFDPAIPNDIVVYFGLKYAKGMGIKEVMTGDGADELFAGYSYMQDIENLKDYIRNLTKGMYFNSNILGKSLGVKIKQPYIDEKLLNFSLAIPTDLKIRKENRKIWGKWILRKAFEDILPKEIVWQSKRPLEFGSGMSKLRKIISDRVSDEEFKENSSSINFISKEHFYYYKIYREVIGKIPQPKANEKKCPGCDAGMKKNGFHCKVCGYVLN